MPHSLSTGQLSDAKFVPVSPPLLKSYMTGRSSPPPQHIRSGTGGLKPPRESRLPIDAPNMRRYSADVTSWKSRSKNRLSEDIHKHERRTRTANRKTRERTLQTMHGSSLAMDPDGTTFASPLDPLRVRRELEGIISQLGKRSQNPTREGRPPVTSPTAAKSDQIKLFDQGEQRETTNKKKSTKNLTTLLATNIDGQPTAGATRDGPNNTSQVVSIWDQSLHYVAKNLGGKVGLEEVSGSEDDIDEPEEQRFDQAARRREYRAAKARRMARGAGWTEKDMDVHQFSSDEEGEFPHGELYFPRRPRWTIRNDFTEVAQDAGQTLCINALGKNSIHRTQLEIEKIQGWVVPGDFFMGLPPKVQKQCCAAFTLEHYSAGQSIYVKGIIGEALYIIQSGQVLVHKPFLKEKLEAAHSPSGSSHVDDQSRKNSWTADELERERISKFSKVLRPGDSFGHTVDPRDMVLCVRFCTS